MRTSETLRSVIDAGRSSKRLDELSAARVIGKIAQQIHAAQQKAGAGKAVGPVTPAHIKLAPSGDAKLELGEGSSLGYSSPEQTMGGFGDRRSDVFSLGAVLWEALTHQRLFDAMNDAAVRMAVQEREIVPPSEINANVPAELSAICMRALHRNPTDRYQSLKAMAVELEEFLEEAGYGDDDSKIASYLASMHEPPPQQLKIAMPPLARPATSTQPPPTAAQPATATQPATAPKQPSAPSMLGEPPRAKNNSGAALAAALANAGATPATSNGSTTTSASNKTTTDLGLPAAKFASTAVGVPKLDEWQDSAGAASHAPPPAAAPVVAVAATSTAENVPQTPMPPVLPSGSTQLRTDKATIAAAVPPLVKVATVEAKHTEAKQPALIVEDKPKAQIVDEHRGVVELKPRDKKPDLADDGRNTLVDGRPPEIEVPKLVNGRLPDLPPGATPQGVADPKPATLLAGTSDAKPGAKIEGKPAEPLKPSQVETVAVAPVRPPSQSDAAAATARAPSQSEGSTRAPSQSDANAKPHPVGAVSLGPNPTRESKDVLAGWGWGTDKHNAIVPESYAHDDDYDVTPPDSRKMLVKIIGAGMGVVALIIIVAFAFGGSAKKKSTAAKEPDTAKPLIDTPAPAPEAAPAPGSAEVATTQPAPPAAPPEPSEADKAAAAKVASEAEAARLAEEQRQAEAAKLSEAERLAAEQKQADEAKRAEAERLAAEQKQAEEAKRAEAARIAAEKKQTDEQKRAEAARVAAEKKQADEARKAEAARIAAEKKKADDARKAEAARIAAEKKAEQARIAAAKKAEAAKTAKTTPKTTPKRPATTKKTETKVATAETRRAEGKLEPEAAYRIGLQQFARGDTSGALASLRTSLAGNPNHAPTWRGLGLVFEKMGEKDQARAAFKRYLQLAPSAGDADQIRSRLERLGS